MECVKYDCTLDDGGDYSRLCLHHWCEQHNLSCDCSSCVDMLKHGLPSFYTNEPWLIDEKDAKDDELEFDYPTWKEQMEDGTLEYVNGSPYYLAKSLENQDD